MVEIFILMAIGAVILFCMFFKILTAFLLACGSLFLLIICIVRIYTAAKLPKRTLVFAALNAVILIASFNIQSVAAVAGAAFGLIGHAIVANFASHPNHSR